jgi:hypothetical protein
MITYFVHPTYAGVEQYCSFVAGHAATPPGKPCPGFKFNNARNEQWSVTMLLVASLTCPRAYSRNSSTHTNMHDDAHFVV